MHNKRWVVAPPITLQADQALAKFPPILKQIVFNRGLEESAFESAVQALTSPVPEPGSWALMAAGLTVIGSVVRRRQG